MLVGRGKDKVPMVSTKARGLTQRKQRNCQALRSPCCMTPRPGGGGTTYVVIHINSNLYNCAVHILCGCMQ